jgi:hypothetical protein
MPKSKVIQITPIFAAFHYPDNETSEAAFQRADQDPQVKNVSVWRSISPDGRHTIMILGEQQADVDRAAEACQPGALGNYVLDHRTMDSLMKRRYKTAFKNAEIVMRGGTAMRQQRAHYGSQGVPFIDGEPRP